jgi:dTMP kinase
MQGARFITLEGGEGTGKSTQLGRLVDRLRPLVDEVVVTREPGGSPGGEQIRTLVLNGAAERWSPQTETLLMYAARRDHIERTITPALNRGATVVCDRFFDSTRAYQGAAGGASSELIDALEHLILDGVLPDLTLIFDLPVDIGLARALSRGGEARFESKGREFHGRLRQAYLAIAKRDPRRCVLIDADGSIEAVEARVWDAVSERLGQAA